MAERDDICGDWWERLEALEAVAARLEASAQRMDATAARLALRGAGAPQEHAGLRAQVRRAGVWGYKTNDRVRLEGAVLQVNSDVIVLGKRSAIIMAILLGRALQGDPSFMPTQWLIGQIEERAAQAWSKPLPKEVHDAIYALRISLGEHSALIETGKPKGAGYRVSTDPQNIHPMASPPAKPRPSVAGPAATRRAGDWSDLSGESPPIP